MLMMTYVSPTGQHTQNNNKKWIRKWEDDESNDREQRQRGTQVVEWETRRRASEVMTSSPSKTTTVGNDTAKISALGQQHPQQQQQQPYYQYHHNYNRWSAGRPHTSSLFGAGCFFLGEAFYYPVVHDRWLENKQKKLIGFPLFEEETKQKKNLLLLIHGMLTNKKIRSDESCMASIRRKKHYYYPHTRLKKWSLLLFCLLFSFFPCFVSLP